MTSREWVLAAINHKPVDRIPFDLGMNTSTGISAFAYWNLKEYLGYSNETTEVHDGIMLLARVEEIIKRLHLDCVLLKPQVPLKMNCPPIARQYGILDNKWGDLSCQKEYQTKSTRRNLSKW